VRDILDALEDDQDTAYLSDKSNGEIRRSRKAELYQRQLYSLRLRLAPLLSLENSLASKVATVGQGVATSSHGPYVRAGWAARSRGSNSTGEFEEEIIDDRDPYGPSTSKNDTVMAHLFLESAEHVHELWHHPVVRNLLKRRRLRLEDSREL
jgi:guanine nucleotide-binding protein alpha-1 subunit